MFKDRLKELRENRGITQAQLATELGVTDGAIGNYENGSREPKNNELWIKIAQYFNVTVDYLMDAPSLHTIAANTGSIDGKPILALSKPENIIRNPKKDILIKLIQENDIPDETLDFMTSALQQYKK